MLSSRWFLVAGRQAQRRVSSSLSSLSRFSRRNLVSSTNGIRIGILNETYDKWERRAPLSPDQVQELLSKHQPHLEQVLVQPSSRRVFPDQDYQQAGAILQDDLQSAHVILGVKRPQSLDALLPQKTYLFFSHVVKGQPTNMPLLEDILHKRIQLVDYECIQEKVGPDRTKRLVAFGRYAGMAGIIDTLHVLGRKLLSTCATPFLQVPSAVLHNSLQDARDCICALGERLDEGLPMELEPLVFCVTGRGGNVHNGVMEILTLLPHEIVTVDDLPRLHRGPKRKHDKIYILPLGPEDMCQHTDRPEVFDRDDFWRNPSNYVSTFANKVAPYIQVLLNCIYWDDRFPRLLTRKQMRELYKSGNKRLSVITDISCDINGSIEFLDRSTTIDQPSYSYDPILQREIDDDTEPCITMLGVDILPTELPRESSIHFGNALSGLLEEMIQKGEYDSTGQLDISKLDSKLADACITTAGGTLAPKYKYLDALIRRARREVHATKKTVVVCLKGHIFDSGLINQVLDVVEANECGFEFLECCVRPVAHGIPQKSTALLRITANSQEDLAKVQSSLQTLVDLSVRADATMRVHDRSITDALQVQKPSPLVKVESNKIDKVLVLGSGRVSASLVDMLGRSEKRSIVVASDDEASAKEVAALAKRGHHVRLDIERDPQVMDDLIKGVDVVVSLLPAPMHPRIAEECIKYKTNLVTASYESEAIRDMDGRARDAGVVILNEVGLDPGLDHMSALRIIDGIKARGGTISVFSSVCGGLPAPEAADNPLKYKFSWSPKGVIAASQNGARYLWEGQIEEVRGKDLLRSAAPFIEDWSDLHLECLPNRNSLEYEKKYGIEDARTIFRGTLRYRGFSDIMNVFQNLGLFEPVGAGTTWEETLNILRKQKGFSDDLHDFVLDSAGGDSHAAARALDALRWLDATGTALVSNQSSVVDSFCAVLENKLQYRENERDMVLMHHIIEGLFDDGSVEEHRTSLEVYGNDKMTAMCKTVGYTAAAAAELVLRDELNGETGVLLPTAKRIYRPILDVVENEGIVFKDDKQVHNPKVEPRDSPHVLVDKNRMSRATL